MRGGPGADVITEGPEDDASLDNVYAEGGDDDIDVVSVPARRDIVDCGPGVDQVEADPLDDVLANCENVIRHDTAVLGTTGEEFQAPALDPGPCEVYRWYSSRRTTRPGRQRSRGPCVDDGEAVTVDP